jgi:hypothetical protein
MKKINCLFLVIAGFLILSVLLPVFPVSAAGPRCHTVAIQTREGIEPGVLTISKGECVVWLNLTRGSDVMVLFKEGKQCMAKTTLPKGFAMDATGCYATKKIPFSETASLTFTESGNFAYQVKFVGSDMEQDARSELLSPSGTIVVK